MAFGTARPATSVTSRARAAARRARRIRTAREDCLLRIEGDVSASCDDEDSHAERGERPKPAKRTRRPVARRSRGRAEALPPQTDATPEPVEDRFKCDRSPQTQVKRCGLSPRNHQRAGSAEPGLDTVQALGSRLESIGGRVQGPAQGRLALAQRAHRSRSNTVRRACMARAV